MHIDRLLCPDIVQFLLLNLETGLQELVILSYAIVCLNPSVSLNNEKNCRAISEDKIAVCEKLRVYGVGTLWIWNQRA